MPHRLLDIDLSKVTPRLPADYPHVGLYDVRTRTPYAARNDLGIPAIELTHAALFRGAPPVTQPHPAEPFSVVVKDRFVCYWFHPPHTRTGLIHGHAVNWSESVLLVRLDPHWSYAQQRLLSAHDSAAIEANIDQQVQWAGHLLRCYRDAGLPGPITVHLIGHRAADSLFDCHRWSPRP